MKIIPKKQLFNYILTSFCSREKKRFKSYFVAANIKNNKEQEESINVIKRRMEISKLKVRENPIVLKINTPEFKSIFTDELNYLIKLFEEYNYEIRLAGGPVRDLLMDKIPADLDFATTATPDQMKQMFTEKSIRMINANGEKHGTITPRILDRVNYEITTLRIDVKTDGRHAEVEFTKDWLLDANRRDLTINSMFLGLDGSVYDYFFGYDDLLKRKVRFVGDAATRIQEDYLRILRYFRFYGRIAENSNEHEQETLQTIKIHKDGLARISGERIWVELKKILQGNFAFDLTLTMVELGLGSFIGLAEELNTEKFRELSIQQDEFTEGYHVITMLSALVETPTDAIKLHERLKFSAYERDLLYFITSNKNQMKHVDAILPFQQMCIQTIGKSSDQKVYVEELLKFLGKKNLYEKLKTWTIPRFPVDGSSLKELGVPAGRPFGNVIAKLKRVWVANEFKSTKDELLKLVPEIKTELNIDESKMKKKPKIQ